MKRSRSQSPEFADGWRGLAIHAWNKQHDYELAARYLDNAYQLAPQDARLLFERDLLDKLSGVTPEKRLARLEDNLEIALKRDDMTAELLNLWHLTGQADKAADILATRKFHPWEGGEGKVTSQFILNQLLRDVSLAILSCLEHDQVLARPGGDEFLVLASNTSQSALEAMASRILTRLRLPFRIGLIEVYTSCSVGISLSPEHGSDSAAIIRHADTAMYTAKEGGRGQFCVFTPEMNQRVFEYLWLDTNLRKALENDQLVIHYQPKITWRGEVRSLEALLRWQSPERGLIQIGRAHV